MSVRPSPVIKVFPDRAALTRAAAEELVARARDAVAARGAFTVALSGGSTPRDLYRLLAGEPWRSQVEWSRTHVFWGDERCVPSDDEQSNYRLAHDLLLSQVPIPDANVFRMRGDLRDRWRAAEEYGDLILQQVPADVTGMPSFDLMLQGLGDDGHTASLLPGDELADDYDQLVAATNLEREGTFRLTVTPPLLQHAACLLFLVAGADKAHALREVLLGPDQRDRYPGQIARQARGQVTWLLDQPAAANLPTDLIQQ